MGGVGGRLGSRRARGQKKQEFRLTGWRLRRLRHLLAATHLRDATCCLDAGYYIYLVVTQGHSWERYQRGLPRVLRPLIGYLNAIMAAHSSYDGPRSARGVERGCGGRPDLGVSGVDGVGR
jgi:hypothetical protein